MDRKYYDAIEGNPVVAAVKDMEGLRICCRLEDIKVVFILFGDICSIGEIVSQVKETGRMAMVHVDLIAGLSYSANGSEVDTVIINGQITMENRKILTVDEKLVYGKIQDIIVRMGLDKKTY